MENLFPQEEFDDWADSYDHSVFENSGFPFDGYRQLLQSMVDHSALKAGQSVLDLGIGTANLALLFQQQGNPIWGLDFSVKMLNIARAKVPAAVLAQADIREVWPQNFERHFDAVVSAYTFHHFLLKEKVQLCQRIMDHYLTPSGRLLIGDIAFENAAAEDGVRQQMASEWEQEYFWLVDESLAAFAASGIQAQFLKISYCAGIFILPK